VTAAPLLIDLRWLGRPGRIAAWRVGDVLIDCGPRTCLEQLLAACGDWRPRALLLTHIHFDHAGAAGELVARWPDLEVWVHRRGARHMVAPERLEASARRVFGAAFDERFGPLTPVPEANIRALDGGERVHGFAALDTPGHASHHLAFLRAEDGWAFPGDVAGVRLVRDGPVLLPTPPPDVDLERWAASVDAVVRREPERLALPHFGVVEDPARFLDEARAAIARQRDLALGGGAGGETHYVATLRAELGRSLSAAALADYEIVVPLDQNFVGLQRWATKRRELAS
jgi:glyoxylase-like metal-dependent hydrolase (beta-lactamase superfamily II)